MSRDNPRIQIIETATRLFAEHGFHATGVDIIIKESGVAKRTLYRHFPSKEDLIVAVLKSYNENFCRQVIEKTENGGEPREKLLQLFDVVNEWFHEKSFFGCMFINAIGEYSQKDTEIRTVCKDFKAAIRSYIESLCRQAGLLEPEQLAKRLALLIEGAIVTAQVSQLEDAALTAKQAAILLIAAADPQNKTNRPIEPVQ